MSLTCPDCGSSGEFIRYVTDAGMTDLIGPYEVRRCRKCGREYQIEIDVDDDSYPDPGCPFCGHEIDEDGYCMNCARQGEDFYGDPELVSEDDDLAQEEFEDGDRDSPDWPLEV